MNIFKLFISAIVITVLSGCSLIDTKWNHPTKTETQFYGDSSTCMSKAANAFPQNIKKNKNYYPTEDTYDTNCTGNSCTTKKRVNPYEAFLGSSDANASNRNAHYTYCMRGLGYTDTMHAIWE